VDLGDGVGPGAAPASTQLACLFEIEDQLARVDLPIADRLGAVARLLAGGLRGSEQIEVEIELHGVRYRSCEGAPTERSEVTQIGCDERHKGVIRAWCPSTGELPRGASRLLRSIAERLSGVLAQPEGGLVSLGEEGQDCRIPVAGPCPWKTTGRSCQWSAAVHLLRRSDRELYLRITRRLLGFLYLRGVEEVAVWRQDRAPTSAGGEVNSPERLVATDDSWLATDGPYLLAAEHLSDGELLLCIERWMAQDRASFFTKQIHTECSSLTEVSDALRRYHHAIEDVDGLPEHTTRGLRVALARRLLTEQLDFLLVAGDHIDSHAIARLLDRVIAPAGSDGKVGGKAAGLVLAERILANGGGSGASGVKVPLTWFVASSGLRKFIAWNDLEEVVEQKYKQPQDVRIDYPDIVRLFKLSHFPPEIVRGVSLALDEFDQRPLIVRSSSLLEDRVGTAFSGKYKSLFLANQGTKKERMAALLDAIAEVYASTFGHDPLEYRRERGLLDFNEEMGVLIQEVVGARAGRFFLPAFAGVAFSRNEFRWSPRIRREDGLVRLVPGLGSRAVDRTGDDYPVLAVPRQSGLRVNAGTDELRRYSPRKVDVIDLEGAGFVTIELAALLREVGTDLPGFGLTFQVVRDEVLRRCTPMTVDPEEDELIATFSELLGRTPFLSTIATTLERLETALGRPVDLEFAHDGSDLYLLQCRTQTPSDAACATPIPKDVKPADVIFTADRHVSNGSVPDLTHLVYVDPLGYAALQKRSWLVDVGRVVGQLNRLLPRRRFALLGPGRWGSRGDIKLGVPVSYADINNAALLVEIARQRGSYVPDLSYGTHFFQDLVEARIRYLPLYPDEGTVLAEDFLVGSPNLLGDLVPGFEHLHAVVRVVDVQGVTGGRVVRVAMDADRDEAMAFLATRDT
jgi:pyruvate, water dikinase